MTENSEFKTGVVHTGLIEQNIKKLIGFKSVSTQAIIAAALFHISPKPNHSSYSHWINIIHKIQFLCEASTVDIEFSQPDINKLEISFFGKSYDLTLNKKNIWSLEGNQLPVAKKFDDEQYLMVGSFYSSFKILLKLKRKLTLKQAIFYLQCLVWYQKSISKMAVKCLRVSVF